MCISVTRNPSKTLIYNLQLVSAMSLICHCNYIDHNANCTIHCRTLWRISLLSEFEISHSGTGDYGTEAMCITADLTEGVVIGNR